METKHLRTFQTIVELESFTRAARRLGLSQSATSQQISALEQQVGTKLFHRTASGARPTTAGEVLAHYARQILRKIDEAQNSLAELESPGAGILRLGATGPACHHLLPPVLADLKRSYPRVQVRLLTGPTTRTIARLRAGELDAGIVALPVKEPRLRVVELGRTELVAIAPPSHEWAARSRLDIDDLRDQAFLMWGHHSRTSDRIRQLFLKSGLFPHVAMEVDDAQTAINLVAGGLGVAIVPGWAVAGERYARRLVALSIGRNGLTLRLGIVSQESTQPSQFLRAFVRTCSERLPELLSALPLKTERGVSRPSSP